MKPIPKEKAEELIRKYMPHVTYYDMADSEPVDYSHLAIPVAKKCAIIAVEEILQIIDDNTIYGFEPAEYWLQVKEELEKK